MSEAPRPKRGEIWDVEWEPGRGSEQRGTRPSLVVQGDALNRARRYPNTIVVAVSTKPRHVPMEVAVEPDHTNGLTRRSYIKCEQLLTIARERLAGAEPRGHLTDEEMARVDTALKEALGL